MELDSFGAIMRARQLVKPPAYEWQDMALRIIKDLGIPGFKRSAVFKVCKDLPKISVERAVNETKELCQTGQKWKYFFKVIDSYSSGLASGEKAIVK